MSTFTKFLNLFKWQPDIDGDEEFDIEKSLNENWDKVDTKLETYMTDLTNDVENYKKDTNNSIQSYKDDTDTQIDTFTTNITNKVNELEGEVSSQKEISISPTAPTSNESVWIKKGKNKFNADELFLEQTNHVTNNNSTNKLSITTNGNYGYSRYKLTIPEEYLNKEVSISFNGVSTINESQNNIRNTIYISSTPDESGDIMTQLLTTTKTKYSIKFTPNSQEIYITLYGTLSDYSTIVTIEMSEIQLELGEPTEYEDYIEKEIYVKNDNGVFERFYKDNGIIDSGSNDNFKYIKFSDGTLIQYATMIFNNLTWNPWGSLYYAECDVSQYKFPVSFIDMPVVNGSIAHGTGSGDGFVSRIGGASTTDIESLAIVRPTTYADSMYVNIIAIGRWK